MKLTRSSSTTTAASCARHPDLSKKKTQQKHAPHKALHPPKQKNTCHNGEYFFLRNENIFLARTLPGHEHCAITSYSYYIFPWEHYRDQVSHYHGNTIQLYTFLWKKKRKAIMWLVYFRNNIQHKKRERKKYDVLWRLNDMHNFPFPHSVAEEYNVLLFNDIFASWIFTWEGFAFRTAVSQF